MTEKFTGGKAQFTLGATDYLCLQNFSWSGSVADAVAQCSSATGAVTVRRPGSSEDKFKFDVILDAGGVTTLNALKRGQTGAFEFHPEGDVAGNIEFVSDSAFVITSSLGGGANALGILSIEIGISGVLTIQVAS